MAIDMCSFADYVRIPNAISACTVYQISFNLFSDVGCAWTRESMAGVHVGFQAGVLASNGKPIDPAMQIQGLFIISMGIGSRSSCRGTGQQHCWSSHGAPFGNDSPLNVKFPVYVPSFKNKATSTASTTTTTTTITHSNKWDQMRSNERICLELDDGKITGNTYSNK